MAPALLRKAEWSICSWNISSIIHATLLRTFIKHTVDFTFSLFSCRLGMVNLDNIWRYHLASFLIGRSLHNCIDSLLLYVTYSATSIIQRWLQVLRMSSCFLGIRLRKEDGNLNSMDLGSVFHVCDTFVINQYGIDVSDKQMFMLESWMS